MDDIIKFRVFLTPKLVSAIWLLGSALLLLLAFVQLAGMLYAIRGMSALQFLITFVTLVVSTVVSLVVLRVALEVAVVLFRIHEAIREQGTGPAAGSSAPVGS